MNKVIALLIIGSMLLAACAAPAAPASGEQAAPASEEAAAPATMKLTAHSLGEAQAADNGITECMLPGQVLFVGPASRIRKVIDLLNDSSELSESIDSEPRVTIALGELVQNLPKLDEAQNAAASPAILPFFPEETYAELEIDLYGLQGSATVEEVVTRVANYRSENEELEYVYAEPNYILGDPEINTEGEAWTPKHSPATETTGPNAPATVFRTQWALQHINNPSPDFTGKGVRVGIFDTSPFTGNGEEIEINLDAGSVTVNGTPFVPPTVSDTRDHGLFAAGLVYSVAPNSDIHLYQSLGNHGQGSLVTLLQSINTFVQEVDRDRANLKGAVINLSLGLHPSCVAPYIDINNTGDFHSIVSLRTLLQVAYGKNISVIAAAGNGSASATDPSSADIPAAWEDIVISVAASNISDTLACFSNSGQIMAPGGDGAERDGKPCQPNLDQCTGDCEFGVVSVVTQSPTGYAYWAGTSFAAPFVSGLAALVLEKEGDIFNQVFQHGGSWMTPTVTESILCRAHQREIIDVQDTLGECIQEQGALRVRLTPGVDATISPPWDNATVKAIRNESAYSIEIVHDGKSFPLGPHAQIERITLQAMSVSDTVAGTWQVTIPDGSAAGHIDLVIDWITQ